MLAGNCECVWSWKLSFCKHWGKDWLKHEAAVDVQRIVMRSRVCTHSARVSLKGRDQNGHHNERQMMLPPDVPRRSGLECITCI